MQEIHNGLTTDQVMASREAHGTNKLGEYKKKGFIKSFFSNLNDPIIKVLIVALFLNIIFMFPKINWLESFGIATSIFIATFVSTISEYSSENAFEKLRQKSGNEQTFVKRAEGVSKIPMEEVVVGDIVLLEAGMGVPADCTLYLGAISVDESSLTGESCEMEKSTQEGKNEVLKGSLVTSGYGEAIVSRVGASTYYGRVACELSRETRPSPLKKRLSHLARSISRLGYLLAIVTAFAYLFNVFVIDSHFVFSDTLAKLSDIKFVFSKLLGALSLAVSITVVAVPEGLPMMITVVLSSNMKKMARDNVLVRKMVGIETSGNINLLFTDKTGTLTEGKLKVKEIYNAQNERMTTHAIKNNPIFKEYLTLCAYFCTNAKENGTEIIANDSVETALLEYSSFYKPRARLVSKNPFDSVKKYSACTVKHEGMDLTIIKGAPEKIIGASSSYLTQDGEILPLGEDNLRSIRARLKELTSKSYRVIAIGIKEGKCDTSPTKITFLCLIALRDRVRREVPEAIRSVQGAGVGVVMITGDNIDTAAAVAKECGIISPRSKRNLVISASELNQMSDKELENILPQLAVVARALPSDKTRLVSVSQHAKYVVGMTGDGINDAPSLKSADVGFAMGSGTDVAKEAGDIVIKDNNFASIVKAILYGRTIFNSIRRFIQFQLIMNFSAVGISLLGPFIGVDTPVTIIQMLWINIIMDTLGALAFACEPPLKKYMNELPKGHDEKILSKQMIKTIAITSFYVLSLCVWFLKSDTLAMILSNGSEKYLLSAFFAMFIFTGVFVCFLSRTDNLNVFSNIGKNKSFILIMLLVSLCQISFIYFGGEALRTVPLKLADLASIILISFTVIIFDLLRKLISKIFRLGKRKSIILEKDHA
ncbi:MAG: calcium-translocating P-type ATPase, PMCA-type [Clostridia bacterium]|nr:calcium-translocating P-type ATPase, PMCA-type [Clostridia bacterium]